MFRLWTATAIGKGFTLNPMACAGQFGASTDSCAGGLTNIISTSHDKLDFSGL
jgi:hypothetical protein